jgi:hypothetical protein
MLSKINPYVGEFVRIASPQEMGRHPVPSMGDWGSEPPDLGFPTLEIFANQ